MEEMIQKIKSSVAARRDSHFVINARTDAIATHGIDEAIRRGNAYADAGATLIFVEAPKAREDIVKVVKGIRAPVSINMLGAAGGKTPPMTLVELQELGVARVSYPILTLCSAAFAMRENLKALRETGTLGEMPTGMMSFADITDAVGLPHQQALGREFA